jgi:hypothetical protein
MAIGPGNFSVVFDERAQGLVERMHERPEED